MAEFQGAIAGNFSPPTCHGETEFIFLRAFSRIFEWKIREFLKNKRGILFWGILVKFTKN